MILLAEVVPAPGLIKTDGYLVNNADQKGD